MTLRESKTYEDYRVDFKPLDRVTFLLIGESPPDPKGGPLRYFYKPELSDHDNLYKAVARAVYGDAVEVKDKLGVLQRLQSDAFWLVDAVEFPINDWHRYSDEDR